MTMPRRVGLTLPVPPNPNATLATALWAEEQGFDDLWFADTGGTDALTMAAAVALQTRRIRIGTAVIPVYTRTPAVLAATAMTLSHLAPDRFVLGLGSSSHGMIEQWHGLPFEKPLTRVRETVQILRPLLNGERSAFEGTVLRSQGYKLEPAPACRVPIFLAGLRGGMLELAGELGDGVALNLFPLDTLPTILKHAALGAEKSGRALADMEIFCRFQVMVTDDQQAARDLFRRRFAPYYATAVYNSFLSWCGYEDAARTIAQGWSEKDRGKTTGALDDRLVNEIAVIGTAEQCRQRVREYLNGGITTAVISSFASTEQGIRQTFEAFSPAVFRPS